MHSGASAFSNNAGPACCSTTLPPATPIRTRLAAAAQVAVPTTFILGERDMMNSAKGRQDAGRGAAEFTNHHPARRRPHDDGERPDELLAALQD